MERILLIGCSGSGKSTLARKLGEKLGMPVIHLDQLWWKPGWIESDRAEFDAKLAAELEKPRWIIDGNFNRTLPMRLAKCDTVIYLDFNRFICLWSVVKRVVSSLGKTRPDMGTGCPEKFDPQFMKWIWNYNKKNRENNYRLLDEAKHARSIILKNRRQVRKLLNDL